MILKKKKHKQFTFAIAVYTVSQFVLSRSLDFKTIRLLQISVCVWESIVSFLFILGRRAQLNSFENFLQYKFFFYVFARCVAK